MDDELKKMIRTLLSEEFSHLIIDSIPIGAVLPFAMKKPPEKWLICDGMAYSIEEYSELFERIGYIFGGNESKFQVPNLNGQFIRGYDSSGSIDPERVFGSIQRDAIIGHRHKVVQEKQTEEAGAHNHLLKYTSRTINSGGFSSIEDVMTIQKLNYTNTSTVRADGHRHSIPLPIIGDVISSSYGDVISRVSNETRPSNIALLYCIKAK